MILTYMLIHYRYVRGIISGRSSEPLLPFQIDSHYIMSTADIEPWAYLKTALIHAPFAQFGYDYGRIAPLHRNLSFSSCRIYGLICYIISGCSPDHPVSGMQDR